MRSTHLALCFGVSLFTASAQASPPKPVAPPPPAPVRSFEDVFDDAEPVTDLAHLVEPLFDTCDPSDPLAYRQCEGSRQFLETEVRGKTYVATGDVDALSVTPYDATTKSLDLEVHGCLACARPLSLSNGRGAMVTRYVTTREPQMGKNGHMLGGVVGTLTVVMPTPEDELAWKKRERRTKPRLRTQFVFKLGATTGSGVLFVPLAYRVLDACSGEVLETYPPLAAGAKPAKVEAPLKLAAGDDLVCPSPEDDLTAEERAAREADKHLPQSLGRELIERGLTTTHARIHRCHTEYDESGMVGVRLLLEGATGKAREVDISPPFDTTSGGQCVRAVLGSTKFSRFTNETQEIKITVPLR